MKKTIGIVGVVGDLGSQIQRAVQKNGQETLLCDPRLPNSQDISDLFDDADIVHICAPLDRLPDLSEVPTRAMIVLHDSVMSISRTFNDRNLSGSAAIVHTLHNSRNMAIVASDASFSSEVSDHLRTLGFQTSLMSIDDHDLLMANSQAPLALLIKTLLPELHEQQARGLLTNSGEILADTLRARQAAWTETTIQSILRNPQLPQLIGNMDRALHKVQQDQ